MVKALIERDSDSTYDEEKRRQVVHKVIKSTSVSAVAPKIADSKSLHNYTLSPGWSANEVVILKMALMKFGIGRWKAI